MNSKIFSTSIFVLVFSILLNAHMFGQSYEVVVNLINNHPVKGKLLDINPDSVSVIEKETGEYLVFQGSEIWSVYIEELNETIEFPISEVPDILEKDKEKTVVPDSTGTIFTPSEADTPNGSDLLGNQFEIGLGLVEASEYNDIMNQIYSDISGGGFWIKIEAGYSFKVLELLYISPRIALLGSRLETTVQGFEASPNTKATVILLFGISGRYLFEMISPSLYASIDISLTSPNTDLSSLELKSDGVALGIGVGYIFSGKFELELGYLSVPVQVQINDGSNNDGNFGGFSLTFRFRF